MFEEMSWEIAILILGLALASFALGWFLPSIFYRSRHRSPSHTPNIPATVEDPRMVEAAERVRQENQQPNARARSGSALLPYPPGGGLGE